MSRSTGVKSALRRSAESLLKRNAKPVRRLLLATGRERAPRVPDIVQIESTNMCNAKCVFCPRDEMHREEGIMDMALYRKIVDECADLGITHVRRPGTCCSRPPRPATSWLASRSRNMT